MAREHDSKLDSIAMAVSYGRIKMRGAVAAAERQFIIDAQKSASTLHLEEILSAITPEEIDSVAYRTYFKKNKSAVGSDDVVEFSLSKYAFNVKASPKALEVYTQDVVLKKYEGRPAKNAYQLLVKSINQDIEKHYENIPF